MNDAAFSLAEGGWYGVSMFPGYADAPYHSPIRVNRIEQLDPHRFELDFLNLAYAAGVQQFSLEFEIVKTAPGFLASEPKGQLDRLYIFAKLTSSWMKAHFPHRRTYRPSD